MHVVLVSPADRPAVNELAQRVPLVAAPILGRSLVEYWIEALAHRGVQHITILASDRPNRIRELVGDGRRWGVQVDVRPVPQEFTTDEAQERFRNPDGSTPTVFLLDHLPDQPERPLFESYESWFAAQRAWMPHGVTPGRIGVREVMPGVWTGLHCEIAASARLHAPCWIGDHVRIEPDAVIGPGAMVDNRCVVERGARIVESAVGPDTYVGRYVAVERSLAHGAQLISWARNSVVTVPDPVLLGDLAGTLRPQPRRVLSRCAAGLALGATAPFALGVIAYSALRGESPWQLRLGLRSQRSTRRLSLDTFGYYELTGGQYWLRRWPQLWNVMRGDMHWIGNRPLRPTQALTLSNDFERLWLSAPVGLISLADAHGCTDGISDDAIAHSSYYAVHANRRLDTFILTRAVLRAALLWPFRMHRRRDATVPLEQLVPKQET